MPSPKPRVELDARSGTGWFIAGYVGLGGFFAVEAAVRDRGAASSLAASNDDQDSTGSIVTASVLAASLAPLLRRLPLRPLPEASAPVGLALQATGLAIRIWSMRTLRGWYTRTLLIEGEQPAIDRGPYNLVRHPGYLGSLMTWTGFAFSSRSVPVIGAVIGLLGRAYSHRIQAEEALLLRELPGYLGYTGRTRKLIPFVW
jgi:protein-S-isoprenylcysteine O-methyltransferase Ste14